jgi:ABC-type polysaccharide/polyol phosphate export permease
VPALSSAAYVALSIMFFTSGIYEQYGGMPAAVQNVVWYSPVCPLIEFARQSFSPGYSTENLSIYYTISIAAIGLTTLMLRKANVTKLETA